LARVTLQLQRLRILMVVPLGPLELADLTDLAAAQLSGGVDDAVGERLYAHTDGNPFFAEELLRDWRNSGAVLRSEGNWKIAVNKDWELPPGIIGVIRQRLTRLQPALVDELRTAAVLGRNFDTRLLASVTSLDPAAIEDHLMTAAAWGLVRREAPNSFAFCHDRTRECLYSEISETRRRRLHLIIGEALEVSGAPTSAQHLAALAYHFARSGDRAKGVLYSQRAAEQALYTYAPAEASAHFRTALALIDGDAQIRGELLRGLGEARLLQGDQSGAMAAYDEAQSWYELRGDQIGAAQALHAQRLGHGQLQALPAARAEIEAAMRLVEHNQTRRDAALGRSYAWRAIQHALQGEWRDVELLIAVARPMTERLAGPQQLSFLRQLRGLVALQRGEWPHAVRELEAALILSGESDPEYHSWRPALLGLLGLLALAQLGGGAKHEGQTSLERLEAILAVHSSDLWPRAAALTCASLGWIQLGEPERAVLHYAELLPMQGELHWFLVDRVLGLVDLARGDWDAATAHLSMAADTAERERLQPELGCALVGLADLELERGRRGSAARAEDLLQHALTIFQQLGVTGDQEQTRRRLETVHHLGPVYVGGLTAREVSVLRLVAAGRSNREIARDLALSDKTVANHLTSIFTKLRVDNRAAAATFGVRHSMV
jgi:DNA-binding CsgD family transcriptional regulator